jgi:hypothetical protein
MRRALAFLTAALLLAGAPVRAADEPKVPEKTAAGKPNVKESAEGQKKRDDANRAKEEAVGKKKAEGGGVKAPGAEKAASAKMFELPKPLQDTLTEEQKAQIAELRKEYGAKLEGAAATLGKILTPELRKAQAEAAAAAAQKVLEDKLSEQQRTDLKAAQAEMETVQRELREKLMALISEEQRAALKIGPGSKEKKPAGEGKQKSAAGGEKKPAAAEKPAAGEKKGAGDAGKKPTP